MQRIKNTGTRDYVFQFGVEILKTFCSQTKMDLNRLENNLCILEQVFSLCLLFALENIFMECVWRVYLAMSSPLQVMKTPFPTNHEELYEESTQALLTIVYQLPR